MRCPHCGSYYTPIEETGPSGLKGILGYFLTGGSWLGFGAGAFMGAGKQFGYCFGCSRKFDIKTAIQKEMDEEKRLETELRVLEKEVFNELSAPEEHEVLLKFEDNDTDEDIKRKIIESTPSEYKKAMMLDIDRALKEVKENINKTKDND